MVVPAARSPTVNSASWTVQTAGRASALLATVLLAPPALLFQANLGDAYMDEIFHVPQAQNYCRGDFAAWDPKITTLPGLYILAQAARPLLWLFATLIRLGGGQIGSGSASAELPLGCTVGELRFLNLFFGVAVAWATGRVLARIHPSASPAAILLRVACVILFPVLHLFFYLFYTDAAAVLATLLMLEASLAYRPNLSAALGAIAILCRQTSVVWVAFTAGASLIALLPTSDASPTVSLRKLLSPSIRAKTFALAAPFGSVGMIFAVFVSLNGGVAVGDKEHHAVGINVMQPCYLALFLFVFLAPWLATAARPISLIRSSALLDQHHPVIALIALVLCLIGAYFFTARSPPRLRSVAHPFLLADNRHFPFYIWRYLFRRFSAPRRCPFMNIYFLCASYPLSVSAIVASLRATRSPLWVSCYCLSCALVVLPTSLLEFRYFIMPALLALLHQPLPSARPHQDLHHCETASLASVLGLGWVAKNGMRVPGMHSRVGISDLVGVSGYAALDICVALLFLFRPFTWPDGSVARFMW